MARKSLQGNQQIMPMTTAHNLNNKMSTKVLPCSLALLLQHQACPTSRKEIQGLP